MPEVRETAQVLLTEALYSRNQALLTKIKSANNAVTTLLDNITTQRAFQPLDAPIQLPTPRWRKSQSPNLESPAPQIKIAVTRPMSSRPVSRSRPSIQASEVVKRFSPYLDSLEIEPLWVLNEIIGEGKCPEIGGLVRSLHERLARRVKALYALESIRPLVLSSDKSLGFQFRGGTAEDPRQRRFCVPIGGRRLDIYEDPDGPPVESYVLDGSLDIPEVHLTRYEYMRKALRLLRSLIPRVVVVDKSSGTTVAISSCRYPGLGVEIYRTDHTIVGGNGCLGPLTAMNFLPVDMLSIQVIADEQESVCSQNRIPTTTDAYYQTRPLVAGTPSSSVTTPSPLSTAATSLYNRWQSPLLQTPSSMSENATPTVRGDRIAAAIGPHCGLLFEARGRCDVVLELGSDGHAQVIAALSLEELVAIDLMSDPPAGWGSTLVVRELEEASAPLVDQIADNGYQVFALALEAIVRNAPHLREAFSRETEAISLYHEVVAGQKGTIDAERAHQIYESIFPHTAIIADSRDVTLVGNSPPEERDSLLQMPDSSWRSSDNQSSGIQWTSWGWP